MGKFKASKLIVMQSWAVLKQDRELMWFPVLSAIISLVVFALFGWAYVTYGPTIAQSGASAQEAPGDIMYVWLLVYYLVAFFVANYFQAAMYVIVHARFGGQDLGFGDGMRGANAKVGKIFVWSLISSTVGVLLRLLGDKGKGVGRVVAAILGAAWGILTYFSLPSLVIGGTTIIGSFKESAASIKKTWGEAFIISFGTGLFFGLLIIAGFLVGGVAAFGALSIGSGALLIIVGVAFLVYIIALSIISSALGSIFKLALYEYARTGTIVGGFAPEVIQNAFKVKKGSAPASAPQQ